MAAMGHLLHALGQASTDGHPHAQASGLVLLVLVRRHLTSVPLQFCRHPGPGALLVLLVLLLPLVCPQLMAGAATGPNFQDDAPCGDSWLGH
jgi:hypothetical protein